MTDTSQTRLSYIAESNYGVTPSTPVFKNLRYTNESLKVESQHVSSNEIRADRNVADVTLVGLEASGDVGFELTYGSFDELLEAMLQGTWTSNVLKNGVVQRSVTLEKTFETGVTDNYHRFQGMMVNTMNLAVRAREVVTGSFGFMGKGGTSAQAIIAGATYTAANSNPVMNAANNFTGAAVTGLTSPQIMGLNLNITNNMRQQPVVGSLNSKGIGSGRFVVSGDADLYFENKELYELFLSDTYADLAFSLGGASSLKYDFLLPKLKFTGAEVQATSNDADVMIKVPFQAIYDPTNAASLKITRNP
jgi:hypothetical protein